MCIYSWHKNPLSKVKHPPNGGCFYAFLHFSDNRKTINPITNKTEIIIIPPFALPVIWANKPTNVVPKKDAPFPQIS